VIFHQHHYSLYKYIVMHTPWRRLQMAAVNRCIIMTVQIAEKLIYYSTA